MAEKPKVLIIGGSGYIGKFIVEASAKAGHPTFAFIRESTLQSSLKSPIIDNFKSLGVNFVFGDIFDNESLVKAVKQVDVVISTVGRLLIVKKRYKIKRYNISQKTQLNLYRLDWGDIFDNESLVKAVKQVDVVISTVGRLLIAHQDKIISAIKEAGNVKRFFPSEFGNDVDRVHAVEPAKSMFAAKAKIRRAVEAEGIPHTFVVCNFFDGYFLRNFCQPGATGPPTDKIKIIGDGNAKVIYNKEEDIATYTIRAIDDPKTLNKILYIRPPANIYSTNDLVSLWEKKIETTLEKVFISEEELLKNIQEAPYPLATVLSLSHSAFVKGDHSNYDIEPSFGVEASEIYSDIQYKPVEEYLNQLVKTV